ncbi:SAP190 [Candida oxycetoniae]|uniref:SAP190 n=1 Tax=Candida oxycetoniae TaxID=497107 RepID=A0AAI9SYD9_9ASCO|nr:SAP190 [Candida oxycetoniae]KAI3405473.2 SAP190 [Candida oxycetoniae]
MSGSFWKFNNGFTSLSNISTLLENHNQSREQSNSSANRQEEEREQHDLLIKLLDENDLLQELLSNNPMLLEFLREEKVLSMLVDIVISKNSQGFDSSEDETAINSSVSDTEKGKIRDTDKKLEKGEQKKKEKVEEDYEEEDDEDEDEDEEGEEEEEGDEESPEDKFRRRATLASEVLSADVWSLTDTVMESTANLNKLWNILDSREALDVHVSTHFMKIMEHLLDMKCDEMITYLIENQPNLVEKFINHLSNPPLMDFLLKLISTDKPDNSTGIIDSLQNQNLISQLIQALDVCNNPAGGDDADKDDARKGKSHELLLIEQSSAADFLKALITISANSTADNSTIGPNELTRELVSKEQITHLCNIMLKGGYALANGVGIIIEIIRKNNSDYDILPILYITLESHPPTGRDPIYLGHLLRVFGENIENFNNLLMKEDRDPKLRTPFGIIEPLGFERFKICELVAELLHCSNMALLNDNRGFDVVKERDEVREKMKEFDPISFKYNETIILPKEDTFDERVDDDDDDDDVDDVDDDHDDVSVNVNLKSDVTSKNSETADDTIDEFNKQEEMTEEEEPHANSNLSEEEIRSNPVVGDFLKIALFDTQIISNILSMFFRFPWNNFLHNVVFDIVQQVLNGSMDIGFNKFLAIDLFHSADITNKIIEGQKLCTDYETSHNGLRLGFMGHLTLIAEEVVKFVQLFPLNTLSEYINGKIESDVWEDYVSNVLYDTREKYNTILGGNDDDDDDDEEDESTTFDEGLGEIIEEVKTGLVFQDDEDEEGEEEEEEEEVEERGVPDEGHEEEEEEEEVEVDEEEEDNDDDEEEEADVTKERDINDKNSTLKALKMKKKDLLDSDESESDEDEHFSNYMSEQLTSASININKKSNEGEFESSNKDEDNEKVSGDDDSDCESSGEDSDEYIDPNDDGMSYKKLNPLYDNLGILKRNDNSDDEKIEADAKVDEDFSTSSDSSSSEEELDQS